MPQISRATGPYGRSAAAIIIAIAAVSGIAPPASAHVNGAPASTNYTPFILLFVTLIIILAAAAFFVVGIRLDRNKPSEGDFDIDADWHE